MLEDGPDGRDRDLDFGDLGIEREEMRVRGLRIDLRMRSREGESDLVYCSLRE